MQLLKDWTHEVTVEGMVTEIKPVQLTKAQFPITLTPSGMVTDVNPIQREKASFPIVSTEEGIVTDANL